MCWYLLSYQRIEYGGLYGVTFENMSIEEIHEQINDRDEIVKLAFYKDVKEKEPIAPIDEKLLEYYLWYIGPRYQPRFFLEPVFTS